MVNFDQRNSQYQDDLREDAINVQERIEELKRGEKLGRETMVRDVARTCSTSRALTQPCELGAFLMNIMGGRSSRYQFAGICQNNIGKSVRFLGASARGPIGVLQHGTHLDKAGLLSAFERFHPGMRLLLILDLCPLVLVT